MNTFNNVSLLTLATGLVSLGAAALAQDLNTNLWGGAVAIILGIVLYVVYEKIP